MIINLVMGISEMVDSMVVDKVVDKDLAEGMGLVDSSLD
jgi:hypothetical protein